MKKQILPIVAGILTLPVLAAQAGDLFSDQMNDLTGWGVNASGPDYLATFNYNYGADAIPEAPNSVGGDAETRGLKLEANISGGSGQFFTVYPLGQNFAGDHQLRFDAWMSYGEGGTTEFLGGGIGYDNVSADLLGGAQAIATGDGGSSQDWRAFTPDYLPLGNGNAAPYVDFLPSVDGSVAGSPGFQWITWEFNVIGDAVSIVIEKPDTSRLTIASWDKTDKGTTTDGNISLFYADFFSSVAAPENTTFGLIDNVMVSSVVPEPTTAALTLMGGLLLLARRRK